MPMISRFILKITKRTRMLKISGKVLQRTAFFVLRTLKNKRRAVEHCGHFRPQKDMSAAGAVKFGDSCLQDLGCWLPRNSPCIDVRKYLQEDQAPTWRQSGNNNKETSKTFCGNILSQRTHPVTKKACSPAGRLGAMPCTKRSLFQVP